MSDITPPPLLEPAPSAAVGPRVEAALDDPVDVVDPPQPGGTATSVTWFATAFNLHACVIAIGATLGLLASDASPTGHVTGDRISIALLGLSTVWLAARAPWWALLIAAAVALGVCRQNGPFALAAAGAAAAAFGGWRRRDIPAVHALSWAFTLNALMRSDLGGFQGLTAIITGVVVVFVARMAYGRSTDRVQDGVVIGTWVVVGLSVISLIGFGFATWRAYSHLRDGESALRTAETALRASDSRGAQLALSDGSAAFRLASDAAHKPWARPIRWIPLASQHAALVADLSEQAAITAQAAADAAASVDLDSIGIEAGAVDIAAIRSLVEPTAKVALAATDLRTVAEQLDSPWLLPMVSDRLGKARDDIDKLATPAQRAVTGLRIAPSLLGADGPRSWFMAFLNPAEARGLGGFMGNWAVLTADNGTLTVTKSGRTRDLFAPADRALRPQLEASVEYLARHGRFGAGGNGQPISIDYWSNISISPDLPTVAGVMADLFEKSSVGQPIEGVITVDPSGLAGMLKLTGPITVEQLDAPITAENVIPFLYTEQYALFPDAQQEERTEALGILAELATRKMLTSDFPGPRVIADALGPSIGAGHLKIWSLRPADQPALRDLGTSGAIHLDTPDGLMVVNNNAGGNKLDAYLDRSVAYDATVGADGTITSTLTVTMRNNAPDGLTAYASSNQRDLPAGTNISYLSIYSPLSLEEFSVDGVADGTEVEPELGWTVYSTYVEIPRGATVVVSAKFVGQLLDGDDYALTIHRQPLAKSEPMTVSLRRGLGEPQATDLSALTDSDLVLFGSDN